MQQMQEKASADKRAMTEKTKESDFAINYDRVCIQQDREDRINKEKYLQQFRNENKRVRIINKPANADRFEAVVHASHHKIFLHSQASTALTPFSTALISAACFSQDSCKCHFIWFTVGCKKSFNALFSSS